MPSTLAELCKHMQDCTEKLEEEIKNNINDCHKLLISNQATETKLALEKAKDYHYKEILDFLREIVTNIRKIIFHEEKIRQLSDEKNFTSEELKRYSYVQRQVNAFSNSEEEVINKREKRRVASEVSLESLEAWEVYLEKKAEEGKQAQEEKTVIPKRISTNNRRKKKKFVSSTFNNFLDKTGDRKLDSILEDAAIEEESNLQARFNEENEHDNEKRFTELTEELDEVSNNNKDAYQDQNSNCTSDSEDESSDRDLDDTKTRDEYSVLNIVKCISQELLSQELGDDKPKIVDVVYKKKATDE